MGAYYKENTVVNHPHKSLLISMIYIFLSIPIHTYIQPAVQKTTLLTYTSSVPPHLLESTFKFSRQKKESPQPTNQKAGSLPKKVGRFGPRKSARLPALHNLFQLTIKKRQYKLPFCIYCCYSGAKFLPRLNFRRGFETMCQ